MRLQDTLAYQSRIPIRQALPIPADLIQPVTKLSGPVLPAWISDTFAAQYTTKALTHLGDTRAGKLATRILDDPFIFLNTLKIGGFNSSGAGASAALIAGSIAPTRGWGAVIGASVGTLAGAAQALLTLPSTTAVVVGALHGLVRGAVAGNISVLESHRSRAPIVLGTDPLW